MIIDCFIIFIGAITVGHIPVELEGNKLGFALFSTTPEIAVICVRGFEGDPRTTWTDFIPLVDELDSQRNLWKACDLLFYGYESFTGSRHLRLRANENPDIEAIVHFREIVFQAARILEAVLWIINEAYECLTTWPLHIMCNVDDEFFA